MPNVFQASSDDDERRMSMSAYGFWRYHGISPELAFEWAHRQDLKTPNLYVQKKAVDNARNGKYKHVIGLKESNGK